MNRKIKKFNAFTILEMIVTMIISSIVISLSIGLYLNFQKTFDDFLVVSDEYNDALTFISWIKTDVEKCKSIENTGNKILLYNNNNTETTYYFSNNDIIRESVFKIDTFVIPVTDFSVALLNSNKNFVNEIKLSLKIDDFDTGVSLKKEYANAVLFEMDEK